MPACFEGSVSTALVALLVLTGWFLLRFPLASARGMMTTKQMFAQGIDEGIPLMEHGATKMCLFALNPILAMFIGAYWQQWLTSSPVAFTVPSFGTFTIHSLLISHVVGYLVSGVAHWTYTAGKYPEADIEPGVNGRRGSLTPCGWVEAVYFGEVVSVAIQIFAFTSGVPPLFLFLLSAYMTGHVWLGNHFWNRIAKPEGFPHDYSISAPEAWVPVVFVLVVLGYLTLASARNDLKSAANRFAHPNYAIAMVYRS